MEGQCGCGAVTYHLTDRPMFVHCCHCSECQKQTGSAFVLNGLIESDRIKLNGPTTEHVLPSPSGAGQRITRCADCGVALFSAYLIRGGNLRYLRIGTLKDPSQCPPDVQIYVSNKLPWVSLSPDIPAFEEYYRLKEQWPAEAQARLRTAIE